MFSKLLTIVLLVSNLALTGYVFKDKLPDIPFTLTSDSTPEPVKAAVKKAAPVVEEDEAAPVKKAAPTVTNLNSVKTFAYYTSQVDPETVGKSDYDLMIVNEADANSRLFDAADIEKMKTNDKLVIAEISVGHAESYRWYWKKEWDRARPSFLGEEISKNKFLVKGLGSNEWESITKSIVDRAIESGYDGILLDGIDAWIDLGGSKALRDETVDYVIGLSKYAKSKNKDFLIFTKNSEQLGMIAPFAAAVDAVVKEGMVYSLAGPKNSYDQIVKSIRELKYINKPVFVIEYVTGGAWNDAKSRIKTNGFIGYSAPNRTPSIIRKNVW